MTKEYLENILTEYGVAFTDSLADRLLKEFEPCEKMVSRGVFEQVMWERDVAIEQLKELGYELGEKIEPCEDTSNNLKALDQSYNSIKTELKPCDDVISRDMALEKMADYVASGYADSAEDFEEYSRIICQLPPVTPQPKTGHWILTSDDDYEYCTCSECGYQNGENWMIGSQIKYCQECGARMVELQKRSE